MKKLSVVVYLSSLFCLTIVSHAESPVPVETVANLDDMALECAEQVERLQKALETEESFNDKKGEDVRQAFGLLACLGQAIAEHKSHADTDIQGAALRDAALRFTKKSSYDEAKAALAAVEEAHAGKASGDHTVEHPWNKLINMHPMMEEMNARNSKLLKVLKRPRGKSEEPMHATTWVVLSLAMHADTHEVKKDEDIPKWHKLSDDFREASVKLAEAIRKKDKVEGRKWFDAANESCDACHEVFQD